MPELKITAAGSGNTTLTISAAEGTNHTKPTNQTVSLSSSYVPLPPVGTDTKTLTAAQWKQITDAGAAPTLLPVGSLTPLIPFKGNVVGQPFDMNIRCRVMHIEDGHPILQIAQNEAGREICLVHAATYGTAIATNGSGFCINRKCQVGDTVDKVAQQTDRHHGLNRGGWPQCYCRLTLMPQIQDCFPQAWQQIMRTSTIWSTAGYSDNNVLQSEDTLYLPSIVNLFSGVTGALLEKCSRWDWCAAGNSLVMNRHDNPTVPVWGFTRDAYRGTSYGFYMITYDGDLSRSDYQVASSLGLRPCFRI